MSDNFINIDLSGIPKVADLTQVQLLNGQTVSIDLTGIPRETYLSQEGPAPNAFGRFWDRLSASPGAFSPMNLISGLFPENPEKERAKAMGALGISLSSGGKISPSVAYDNYDSIAKAAGGKQLPTPPQLVGGLGMMAAAPFIASGLFTHPLMTIGGLAAYTAMNEAENAAVSLVKGESYRPFAGKGLVNMMPERSSQVSKDVVGSLDEIGKILLAGWAGEGLDSFGKSFGKQIAEKALRDIIVEHNLPKTLYISPEDLRAQLQTGGVLPPEQMDIYKSLGLDGAEVRQALKDGLNIEIPAERVVTMQDKPWWGKIKSMLRLKPYQETVSTFGGKAQQVIPEARQIPETAGPSSEQAPVEQPAAPQPPDQVISAGNEQQPAQVIPFSEPADHMTPQVIEKKRNKAVYAIDKALDQGITDEGTALLAKHLVRTDPTFDANSSLEFADQVKLATDDVLKQLGIERAPNEEYAIFGETQHVRDIEKGIADTAIKLYQGHDADTLVEEWYHRGWNLLSDPEKRYFTEYHNQSGDTRPVEEHFAQEGRDFFFSEKMHEPAGGIRKIFELFRERLLDLIDRIRNIRNANIPEKIKEMYRRAGRPMTESAPAVPDTAIVSANIGNFVSERSASPYTGFLTSYTPEELKDSIVKRVAGYEAGYAIKSDGDIINVYNNTDHKGLGAALVIDAVQRGGRTLDCIDGHLVKYYQSLGFKEYNRVKWDDKFAPKNWDYEKYGRPDVVFLRHEGETNADFLRRSYEAEWGRRLDADPVTAEVLDHINRRSLETASRRMVQGEPSQAATGIETGVQRALNPNYQIRPIRRRQSPEDLLPKNVKERLHIATGKTRIKDLIEVREDLALKEMLRREAAAARDAYREGKRLGVDITSQKYEKKLDKAALRLQGVKEKDIQRLEALRKTYQSYRDKVAQARVQGRATRKARKIINGLKKIDTSKMSPPIKQRIDELLEPLDLTKLSGKKQLSLEATRKFLAENPNTELPEYVMDDLARLDKTPASDLTLNDLESLNMAVKHYVHLERLKNKLVRGQRTRQLREVLESAISDMKPAKKLQSELVETQNQRFARTKNTLALVKDTFGIRHNHYNLVIEALGGQESIMNKVLYRDIKTGIKDELAYRQAVFSKFREEIDNWKQKYGIKNIKKWLDEKAQVGKFNLTRNERMSLYRHSLNPDNRRAILEGGFGLKWSSKPNQVHKITEDELNAILADLTESELSFAGAPVDHLFSDQGKDLAKVFLSRNGYEMPLVDNYYPKEVMPLERGGLDVATEEGLEALKTQTLRVGLSKGMLKERIGSKAPIFLNPLTYDLNKSVRRAAAYVNLELPLSNASRLLYNTTFKKEIVDRYGPQTWKEIEGGLKDIASDWKSYTTVEQLLLKLKNNAAVAWIGLNPWTMLRQLGSAYFYLPYVKMGYLRQGLVDALLHPVETAERHKLYSPEFAERVEGGYNRDVSDLFKSNSQRLLYGGHENLKEFLMGGVKMTDRWTVSFGMQAAVLQALDEFEAGKLSREVRLALDLKNEDLPKLSAEDKLKQAYEFADFVVEHSQPMFSPEHQSSLQRGTPIEKLITMFGSFTSQELNLLKRTWGEVKQDKAASKKWLWVMFATFLLNPFTMMALDELRDAVTGRKPKPAWEEYIKNITGMWFIIRDVAYSAMDKIVRGAHQGSDVSVTPAGEMMNSMADFIANASQAFSADAPLKRQRATSKAMDNGARALSLFTGIPYQAPKQIVESIYQELQ